MKHEGTSLAIHYNFIGVRLIGRGEIPEEDLYEQQALHRQSQPPRWQVKFAPFSGVRWSKVDNRFLYLNRGEHSYFLAMNKHGDLLANEVPSVIFMGIMDSLSNESATFITPEGFDVPDKVITEW